MGCLRLLIAIGLIPNFASAGTQVATTTITHGNCIIILHPNGTIQITPPVGGSPNGVSQGVGPQGNQVITIVSPTKCNASIEGLRNTRTALLAKHRSANASEQDTIKQILLKVNALIESQSKKSAQPTESGGAITAREG